ncbi:MULTISPECIES: MotE family protein [Bartonella]|uniref:Flagellar motility protein MotE, a chaperone for MotC folding n=1 Tax=Bartonella choladocola TaxID=2750995 RepID=A0A1U9MG68_9HYPH|nr:Flagellar motility protein MotE, a chaperone for MotC folding [Bartonella choladocola]MBH9974324.1 MotE family protein [Bartonella choladocola]MBI0013931.1 MotE family protein [Bartonella sp. B10834G3]MBI0140021.1 MotE family protein [Bartonella choladocola]
MMRSRRKVLAVLGLVPFFGLVNTALAQKAGNTATQNKSATVPSAPSAQRTLPSANASQDEIEKFCGNIDSQAADARFELQSQQLQQLRTQIDDRIKVLEEKRQEYENWLNKRNEFLAKAQDSLVNIISKMRPDAAAAQLALVDDFAAAAIMLKLTPRVSSAIMNELPPEKSANLTKVLVSAQKLPPENKPAPKAVKAGQ